MKGWLGSGLALAAVAWIVVPAWSNAVESNRLKRCFANLKQIDLALSLYQQKNNDFLPAADGRLFLSTLYESGYVEDPSIFVCPSGNEVIDDAPPLGRSNCSYLGRVNAGPYRTVSGLLATCEAAPGGGARAACRNHPGKILVLRSSVLEVTELEFEEQYAGVLSE